MAKQNKKSFPRENKVAAAVRQFVAGIIHDRFPNLNVTIVDAEAAGGLQFVRVFYQGDITDFSKIIGQIRYELAHRMNQKYVPELEFAYDDTLEKAERIEELLKTKN
jgi:ribosome-binding factor A